MATKCKMITVLTGSESENALNLLSVLMFVLLASCNISTLQHASVNLTDESQTEKPGIVNGL